MIICAIFSQKNTFFNNFFNENTGKSLIIRLLRLFNIVLVIMTIVVPSKPLQLATKLRN